MRAGRLLVVVAGILIVEGPAAAEPDEPWAAGVSVESQVEARRLFDEGNLLFEQEKYAQALSIYRNAVKTWDHPSIRFNMAVANIHLDQPLAAYEDLTGALRYGAAPLRPDTFAQALTYRKLLLGQLAQLKVTCSEPGVQVFLNGELFFTGPGVGERVLMPGKHQLVASKPTFITATRAVTLAAGGSVEEVLQPVAMPKEVRTERRWAAWLPWAVAAGGVAVAVAGIPVDFAAKSSFDEYDSAVTQACPSGCQKDAIPAPARDIESRAGLERAFAIGLFATGAAVAASGVVMLVLNQPHPVETHITVAPAVADGAVGLLVIGRF